MERWCGRVAIVTGASVGIGAVLTGRLVKHGMKVVGCARNIQPIEELASELKEEKGELIAVRCDVTKEDAVLSVMSRVKELFGGVDVLVNNAGLAHSEPLLSGNTDKWRNMMEVNVMGVAMFTREAVKNMTDRKVDDGHVININSLSGHSLSGSAAMNFYGATKFALTAMTEGVRCELRQLKSHIRISQVCPGAVYTEFWQRMKNASPEEAAQSYASRPHMEADNVVDSVIYQLSAPPHVQVYDILIHATGQIV